MAAIVPKLAPADSSARKNRVARVAAKRPKRDDEAEVDSDAEVEEVEEKPRADPVAEFVDMEHGRGFVPREPCGNKGAVGSRQPQEGKVGPSLFLLPTAYCPLPTAVSASRRCRASGSSPPSHRRSSGSAG